MDCLLIVNHSTKTKKPQQQFHMREFPHSWLLTKATDGWIAGSRADSFDSLLSLKRANQKDSYSPTIKQSAASWDQTGKRSMKLSFNLSFCVCSIKIYGSSVHSVMWTRTSFSQNGSLLKVFMLLFVSGFDEMICEIKQGHCSDVFLFNLTFI